MILPHIIANGESNIITLEQYEQKLVRLLNNNEERSFETNSIAKSIKRKTEEKNTTDHIELGGLTQSVNCKKSCSCC